MRNMLTGDNPARAGEDSYGKSEAIMIPPKGTGPLLKQRLWLYFCSRVIWNDNDQMYMYRQSPNANTEIFLFILQEKSCSKWGMVRLHSSFFCAENAQIIIAFVHSILFSISLVIENSRSAVSGEQPKLETNSFSSVLSGFVI